MTLIWKNIYNYICAHLHIPSRLKEGYLVHLEMSNQKPEQE